MKYELTEENIKFLTEKAHKLLCPQCNSESCGWLWEYEQVKRKDDYWLKNFADRTIWDLETHTNWLSNTKKFISIYSIYTLINLLNTLEENPVCEKLQRILYCIFSN